MWQCKKCKEDVDDSFEVCWNCGTTSDGVADPSFCKKDGLDPPPLPDESIEGQLALRFRCAKCDAKGGLVKRIATTGTGLSRVLDIQLNKFVAVSCESCGYTELYNTDILERPRVGMDVLDLLFGR